MSDKKFRGICTDDWVLATHHPLGRRAEIGKHQKEKIGGVGAQEGGT